MWRAAFASGGPGCRPAVHLPRPLPDAPSSATASPTDLITDIQSALIRQPPTGPAGAVPVNLAAALGLAGITSLDHAAATARVVQVNQTFLDHSSPVARFDRAQFRLYRALERPAQWITAQQKPLAVLGPPDSRGDGAAYTNPLPADPIRGRPSSIVRPAAAFDSRMDSLRDGSAAPAAPTDRNTMSPIISALRRPITVLLFVPTLALGGLQYLPEPKDIFPAPNQPVVYLIHSYGWMDPKQVEGLITRVYEQNFQYIEAVYG